MSEQAEVTVDSILADARLAGLPLTHDEAEQLLKGVRRNREMAQKVRAVLNANDEPAPVFDAAAASREA